MFISNLSLCSSLELQIYSNYLTSFTTIILVKVLSYKVTVITSFQPISLDLTVISKQNLKFIYIWNLVLSLELHFYCNNLFSVHLLIISSITSHLIYHMFISNLHIYCKYPLFNWSLYSYCIFKINHFLSFELHIYGNNLCSTHIYWY